MSYKTFVDLELKAASRGGFVGIASSPTLDRDGERLLSGCFNPLPKTIPVLLYHDHTSPVGRAVPHYRGSDLYVDGTFSTTARGQEARTLVKEGTIDRLSVGFISAERKTIDGVPCVVGGELIEVSLVPVSSNREAAILTAKSGDDFMGWVWKTIASAEVALALDDAKSVLRRTTPKPKLDRNKRLRPQVDAFFRQNGIIR